MNSHRIDSGPLYDPAAVQPMREEMLATGFEELFTPADVDAVLKDDREKSILVFVNSVCGCSAGSARPGVNLALQHRVIPDRFVTIFAGQEREALAYFRQTYLAEFAPSSPCVALFKRGELVYFMPRHQIEGRAPEELAAMLIEQFENHCSRPGPSISREEFEQILPYRRCGSSIPLYSNQSREVE